jgi:hypothetical protein
MTMFPEGSKVPQDPYDTRRLADRMESKLVADAFDPQDREFIESRDMYFLASADAPGCPTCSYKGSPVPGWKRSAWATDVLPEGDPALDPNATVL